MVEKNIFLLNEVSAYIIVRDTNPDQANSMWPTFQSFLEDLVIALIGDIRGKKATALVPDPTRRTEHNIDRIFKKKKIVMNVHLQHNLVKGDV